MTPVTKYIAPKIILLLTLSILLSTDIATVTISEEDVELKGIIGKGQFGTVHKGTWKGMQVAIKCIAKGYGEPDMKEIDICRFV